MAHIRSRRRSCWFLLCFCGWFLDGLCLKRDAWWEKTETFTCSVVFPATSSLSWTLLASNARVLCCPYHSKIMPSCENMEVQVGWQCSIAVTHIQVSNFGMFSQHADQHGDRGSIPLFHVHRSYYWVRMHCNRNICTILTYLLLCVYIWKYEMGNENI